MSELRNLRKLFHQWGGATALFFTYTHMSHDLCTGLLAAMLPLIREGFSLGYLESGLLLAAYTVTSGLSQFLGGWLGDRLNKRTVIAIGLGGVGLAAIAVGLSPTYYLTLVILVIMGIFAGAYHPSAVSTLSSSIEEARRGKAIALHMVGGSMGFTIGPILGGVIAGVLGWRFAFIILSVLAFAAVILVLKKFGQLKDVMGDELGARAATAGGVQVKPMERRAGIGQVLRVVAAVITLAILTQLIGGSVMAFTPIYLVDKHNVAPAYAAMLMGIVRSGGLAGSLFGGWLSDKWGRRNAIFLALMATGPIVYLLTRLPFNLALVVVFILFGLVMSMRQSTVQPYLMDSTPPQLRATIFGIYFGLGMEGSSMMQPVVGHFMDIFGIISVFNFIALAGLALSLVTLLLLRRPKVVPTAATGYR
ncbi:MFS transporter [Chloroflexota bacterium]